MGVESKPASDTLCPTTSISRGTPPPPPSPPTLTAPSVVCTTWLTATRLGALGE